MSKLSKITDSATPSNLIPKEVYQTALDDAVSFYWKNREFNSPFLWQVKVTKHWFQHLQNKWFENQRKRNPKDAYVRLKCFPHVWTLLRKLWLPQEYRCKMENTTYKKGAKVMKQQRKVEYFAFIGILYSNMRVKVVIRKPDWYEKAEFHSIQPAWQMESYQDMSFRWDMFHEDPEEIWDSFDSFITEIVSEDIKKSQSND